MAGSEKREMGEKKEKERKEEKEEKEEKERKERGAGIEYDRVAIECEAGEVGQKAGLAGSGV